MKRRDFLKLTSAAGLTALAPMGISTAHAAPYNGTVIFNVMASGGWDIASFCDPKQDSSINNWAVDNTIQTAGNIPYAPFANNAAFFNKHYERMLVINGIDHQTNSHTSGKRHMSIGRLQNGFPTLAALFASIHGTELPMSFIASGNHDATDGLIASTKVPSTTVLDTITNVNYRGSNTLLRPTAFEQLAAARISRLNSLRDQSETLPRKSANIESLYLARTNSEQLAQFGDLYQSQKNADAIGNGFRGRERRAHIALIAAATGMCVSSTLEIGGFDTHDNHDERHTTALSDLTGLIDSIWDKAEELSIADRLLVYVHSDFARTPWYNDGAGKDHWAIGSALVMKNNVPWTNRVIGGTDEGLRSVTVNPTTLEPDANGIKLEPKHLHSSLRNLVGIESELVTAKYPLLAGDVDFFA